MFARTDRLLLRPPFPEDAPAIHNAIAAEQIVRNLAKAPWPYRMADAEAFVARERDLLDATLLIFRRTRGAPQLIGTVGISEMPSRDIDFGYLIARPHWGLGYATEAGRAVVEIARDALRLKSLTAGHFLDNPASGRVLEKLGFRPTGEIAQRYSAGRRAAAPCRLYRLTFQEEGRGSTAVENAVEAELCNIMAA
jgi:RimJ/RimL family protein N-acetyltransferase